jgi:hypothetical protein
MKDFLSGYNFARQSDVVFSETIPEGGTYKIYVAEHFELESNNVIFCKTDSILNLFEILKDENEIKDLKLITHESDYEIDQRLFSMKPKCISKWYALNANYKNENLIPIPIGLANDYCPITLKYENLKRKGNPKKLLYINHRNNTFPSSREWLYNYFETNEWCTVKEPNLSLSQYKEDLDNHSFILCPRGNGIDTHRLWESLYHGIIPIVEKSIQSETLEGLPAVVVDSFKQVDKEFLEEILLEFSNKKFNIEKLNVSWWIKLIRGE